MDKEKKIKTGAEGRGGGEKKEQEEEEEEKKEEGSCVP